MKIKRRLNSDFFSKIIESLGFSLNTQITYNTNIEIDVYLERAKHEECEESMNWLIFQFMPLIISISSKDTYNKKNGFTGKNKLYVYEYVREEDVEDLTLELVLEFKRLVEIFNWETAFNAWAKSQLEWFAINWHNTNNRYNQREITSLNSTCAELNGNGYEDEEEEFVNRTENDRGLWHKDINQREYLKDREIYKIILNFVKSNFDKKRQDVFKMHFIDGMSMSEIAIRQGYHYHSTISNLVKEMKQELMEYLSKLDEDFDEIYDKQFVKRFDKEDLESPDCILTGIDKLDDSLEEFDFKFDDFSDFTVEKEVINLNKVEIIIYGKITLSSVKDIAYHQNNYAKVLVELPATDPNYKSEIKENATSKTLSFLE